MIHYFMYRQWVPWIRLLRWGDDAVRLRSNSRIKSWRNVL